MGTLAYKSEPKFGSVMMKGRINDYVILKYLPELKKRMSKTFKKRKKMQKLWKREDLKSWINI